MVNRQALEVSDLQSDALKEICLVLKLESKQTTSYYLWSTNKTTMKGYYPFSLLIFHFPLLQSFPSGDIKKLCLTEWETHIIDNTTSEHLEIPIKSIIQVKVKSSKRNPVYQFRINEGYAEVTEIRRVYLCGIKERKLVIAAFMQPT